MPSPKYRIRRDTSWAEFLHTAEHGPFPEGVKQSRTAEDGGSGSPYSWDYATGWDGALDLAKNGWSDGVTQMIPMSARLADRLERRIERIEWFHDVEPAQLDVAAYLQGEPECWLCPALRIVAGQGSLVHIVVNGAATARVEAHAIMRAGSAVYALADLLERSGHGTRVTWVESTKGQNDPRGNPYTSLTTVALKDYGEPLNMGRMAFALAHPAMLRRLWFAYAETWPAAIQHDLKIGGSYGGVNPIGPDEFPNAVIVNFQQADNVTESWVLEQLEAQGVSLKTEVLP